MGINRRKFLSGVAVAGSAIAVDGIQKASGQQGDIGLDDAFSVPKLGPDSRGIKIGFISDVHHSTKDIGTKICTHALPIVQSFKSFCARTSPDIVVDMGDIIQETNNRTADLALVKAVGDAFSGFGQTVEHIPGNHDVITTSEADLATAFGSSVASRSVDVNGFHLVMFCPNVKYEGIDFALTDDELKWLEKDLAGTDLPAIVFSHISLNAGSLVGNHYFSKNPGIAGYTNGGAARAIISNSTVILCMNGHVHWNAVNTLDGVPYVTIQSATECATTGGKASEAYGVLTVDERTISIGLSGYDAVAYRFPRRAARAKWL